MKWLIRLVVVVLWGASIDLVFGLGALVGMFDMERAEGSISRSVKAMGLLGLEFEICGGENPLQCGFRDTRGRERVDCADFLGERSAVLMTFGQSNSANAGRDRYIPIGRVANFNIHDGRCYRAEDPLLGPDAEGGSVWGVLGDKLIAGGYFDTVLVLPFGIGGSALSQWQADGVLQPLLQEALRSINQSGIEPTHILWHQGEADAGSATSEAEYFAMFEALVAEVRGQGFEAPIYPAVATHCQIPFVDPRPDFMTGIESVRAAQQRLPQIDGVMPGPDTDTIQGKLYRHDNCHFTAKGMQAHADAWLAAITGPTAQQ